MAAAFFAGDLVAALAGALEGVFAAALAAGLGLGLALPADFPAGVVFVAVFLAAGVVFLAAAVGVGASENIGPPLALGLDAPNATCLAENPLAPVLAGAKTLEDVKGPLPLDATRAAWATVSAALRAALESLTPEQLDAPSTMRFPISDKTLLGVIAFLVQHDAYHLGQLSLLRRQLGLAGMSYK